jgi:hypothetical protein
MQPEEKKPLSFQDLMGLFSMLNNQTQQGIQGVNQIQELQQRQQEQPFRDQILQSQAELAQYDAANREEKSKMMQDELLFRALGSIRGKSPYESGGNEAYIVDALKQKFGFTPQVPMGQQQMDPTAAFNALIQ